MAITRERAMKITDMLTSDPNRAKELLSLRAEEALERINGGCGFDFTLSEIQEYSKILARASELSDVALESVAGGVGDNMEEDLITITAGALIAAGLFLGGGAIGFAGTRG